MTEILIRENVEQVVEFDRRMNMTRLMDLLTLHHHDAALLDYLAATLRVDLNRPRQSVIGRFTAHHQRPRQNALRDIVTRSLCNSPHTLFHTTEQGCDLLLNQSPQRDWLVQLRILHENIEQELDEPIVFGIGTIAASPDDYWLSYKEALTAVQWQLFQGRLATPEFDDLDLGLVVTSIPSERIEKLVSHVFDGVEETRIDDFATVFDAYTRHNGSITHAAQELFIHKNTMQNRLDMIASSTGYNPRKLRDYMTLAIAFISRDYLHFVKSHA